MTIKERYRAAIEEVIAKAKAKWSRESLTTADGAGDLRLSASGGHRMGRERGRDGRQHLARHPPAGRCR